MIRIKSDKISWRYILILLRFTKTRLNMYCNKQIMRIHHSDWRPVPNLTAINYNICPIVCAIYSWKPWNLKTEFPGNWTKNWISPESARFTESFSIFWNKKVAHTKKLFRFLIPEFNLDITYIQLIYMQLNTDERPSSESVNEIRRSQRINKRSHLVAFTCCRSTTKGKTLWWKECS